MSHEVETRMVAGGNLIWQNLPGTVELPSNCDEQEALELAKLNWTVSKQPLFTGNPDDGYTQVPNFFATVRDSDAKPLGVVKERYEPFQNSETAAFASAIVGTGECVYASAVSLRGGQRIFFVLEFPETYKVGPDNIKRYLLVASSHDGSLSLLATQTDIRAECANTLRASLKGSDNVFKVKHTRSIESRAAQARNILGLASGYSAQMQKVGEELLARKFSNADWNALLDTTHPVPEEEGRGRTVMESARDELGLLYFGGENLENVRGTAWCAWQAYVEYNDHKTIRRETDNSTKGESRFESVLFDKASLTQRVFALLTE